MKTLEGKLALVTGGGSGIGRATAMALAQEGARILVVDIDEARVAEMRNVLGPKCVFAHKVDVADRSAMRALADEVHRTLGAVDVLVNNAGVGHSGGVLDSSLQDWDWVIGVNVWGVVHGCHFFVPKMIERGGGGHVVNVASGFGLVAAPGVAPYCTTKFAVVGLSESMRAELAPHGIGVSAICPGVIATDIIHRGRFADESMRTQIAETFRRRGHEPELVAQAIVRAIKSDRGVVPVGTEAWLAYVGKRFAPGLMSLVGQRIERIAKNGGKARA